MSSMLRKLVAIIIALFISPVLGQSITPQIGGGISQSFDGGISSISGAFQGPVLAPYTGQVATRSAAPVSVTGTPSSALYANSSSWHFARDSISSLQVILPNFMRDASGNEATTGGNIVYRASIEYPIGANKQSFLFSASASVTVAALASATSDALSLATPIPIGAIFKFWVNIDASATTTGVVFGMKGYAPNGDAIEFSATPLADKTTINGATITASGQPPLFPTAILGTTTKAAILMLGDSRVAGAQDVADATGDVGEIARSLGPYFAYSNMGMPSSTANGWRFFANANQKALKPFFSHIVFNTPGINDMSAQFSLAQDQANLTVNVSFFAPKPVFGATIVGSTNSTDGWITTGNQTTVYNGNPTVQATFNSWNAGMLAGTPPSGLTGVFDLNSAISVSETQPAVFKVPGGGLAYTPDGLHENKAGNLLIQSSGVINPRAIH